MNANRAGPSAMERATTYTRARHAKPKLSLLPHDTQADVHTSCSRGGGSCSRHGVELPHGLQTACSSAGVMLELGVSPSLPLCWQHWLQCGPRNC